MMSEDITKRFLINNDDTGRFIVKSQKTGKTYFVEALDSAILLAEQLLEHEVHTFLVVGHVVHEDFLFAVGQGEFQESVVEADALYATLC